MPMLHIQQTIMKTPQDCPTGERPTFPPTSTSMAKVKLSLSSMEFVISHDKLLK